MMAVKQGQAQVALREGEPAARAQEAPKRALGHASPASTDMNPQAGRFPARGRAAPNQLRRHASNARWPAKIRSQGTAERRPQHCKGRNR